MNKPRVLILSTFITPLRSGAEACTEEVARELRDQYDITILAARMSRSVKKKEVFYGNVAVHRIGFGSTFDKWLFPFLAPLYVARYKPQIIHAILESFAGIAMLTCKLRLPRVPTILTCQNTYTNYKGKVETSWLLKPMHKHATRVTVLSRALLQRAKKLGRTDAIIIPNGVRLSDIPPHESVFGRIVYVGRLEPIKGIDILLKAFALLPPHAHLRIVGDGSLRHELELQASMLGIIERVTFVGPLPNPDVYEEFAKASIFCGLSRSEAFGNVFIEAQAAKCAVVATNVDGIPDIVLHEKTGLLVEPENVEQAAEAMQRVLDDKDYREQLAKAAYGHAQLFDWSNIAREYAKLYKELLVA